MNLYPKFAEALPLDDFLARHGTAADRTRWHAVMEKVALTAAQRELLGVPPRDARAGAGRCVVRRLYQPMPDL